MRHLRVAAVGLAGVVAVLAGLAPDGARANREQPGRPRSSAREPADMFIKRSDVVFNTPRTAEAYSRHGATLVGWGHLPWNSSEAALDHFRGRVQSAHEAGVRYAMGVPFRTAFQRMIDFEPEFMGSVCRALDGEPITVPWLWDQTHKGHPAYWFCTNAPRYQAFLKHLAQLGASAEVDGLHIDDYNGTAGTEWLGGCFCPWCMAGFRDYLKEKVPEETLRELGVADLDTFDYGEFLRGRGVTRDQFTLNASRLPPALPLTDHFLTYQYSSATAWVAEYHRYVETLAGRALPLSVNSGAGNPKSIAIAPHITYFCGEVPHRADRDQVPGEPIVAYKLGDALGRPIVCMAMGTDWAYVAEHNRPGLVRTWIAQAYAFGHQLMAPVRQWAYTEEKGTHWYEPAPGEYDYLYRFVREHAHLFDGYDAVAHVGLLYSNAAARRIHDQITGVCVELARQNVTFKLVIAGDDWLPNRLTSADLDGLRALVVVEPTHLDSEQRAVMEAAKDRTVAWPDKKGLFALAPRQVVVGEGRKVMVVPRASRTPEAPFVCHLLNRDYVPETDSLRPQRNVTVRLAGSLFGAPVRAATLYAPGRDPQALQVAVAGEWSEILLPEIELWAVLELGHDRAEAGRRDAVGEAPGWIREVPGQVLAWLETIQYQPKTAEEPWGLFTFSRDCPVAYSVYATSAAWGLATACGGIEKLPGYTPEARARMAKFIQQLQDPKTGLFSDPHLEAVRVREDGLDRFRSAVTKYAFNLLTYCGAKPLHPYSSAGEGGKFDPERYLAEMKSGNWDEPWAIGSHSGNQTRELYWLVNQGHPEYIPALKEGVEFILSKQNPETGMWGRADLPLDQQLGGALKVIGRFQFAMGLIVPHMDRLADSLIQHHRSRAFYPDYISPVIPRNVAELAYACTEVSDYRKAELLEVLRETAEELRKYQQPDGAFAQGRSGTKPVWWNDAEAVPASDTPRSDVHGASACLYAIQNTCEWMGWRNSPWPRGKHWRQALAERQPKYVLHVDPRGKVVVEHSDQ